MSDETTQFILGDAAVDALGNPRRKRRWFRRRPKIEPPPLTHCENCGAALTGEYCSACGQHAIDYRRSLGAVLVDAADSFFNWDTKFLKSLGVLVTRPWRLTNDFNAGRRARYVHPLRLYLLGSIAFFLIARLANLTPSTEAELKPQDRAEIAAAMAKLNAPGSIFDETQRAKIEVAREKLEALGGLTAQDRKDVKSALAAKTEGDEAGKKAQREERRKLRALLSRIPEIDPEASPLNPENQAFIGPPLQPLLGKSTTKQTPGSPLLSFDKDVQSQTEFEKWMEGRVKAKFGENGTNTKVFIETLRSNIPTMMLCCIPLFAFVLKALYFFQRRYYVEHLVYALHIHTFAYAGVVLITLFGLATAAWPAGLRIPLIVLLSIAMTAQVFLSIRRVYRQGWFFTTFKFFLGGIAYSFILVLAVGATAFITLLLPS